MIIDTHAHLDMKEFDEDRDAVVKRAFDSGVEIIINPGVDLKSSQRAVGLSKDYSNVYAAVGIQPEEVDQYFEAVPDPELMNPRKIKIDVRVELEKLARNDKVVAIGECGLDYKEISKIPASPAGGKDQKLRLVEKEKQKDVFRRQLGTAVLLDLPAIVHTREADEDTVTELLRYKETKKLRGVIHCFTGTLEFARRIIDLGFLLSFTGMVAYPKNDGLRRVIREISLDKIMVETDSPFLAPQAFRGQRNEPSFVIEVINTMAQIKGIGIEKVCSATTQNAKRLSRLD